MQPSQPKSLSYTLDYPAELWSTYKNPAVETIQILRSKSQEFDEMLANSLTYTWTTTWQTNQNMVRLVIYIEYTEEQLAWMLLKYPQNKRVINV